MKNMLKMLFSRKSVNVSTPAEAEYISTPTASTASAIDKKEETIMQNTVNSTPAPAEKSSTFRTYSLVCNLDNQIAKLNGIVATDFDAAMREADNVRKGFIREEPFTTQETDVCFLTKSALAEDILGMKCRGFDDTVIVVDYSALCNKGGYIRTATEELEQLLTKEQLGSYCQALKKCLTVALKQIKRYGVEVKTEKYENTYLYFTSSASHLKQGCGLFVRAEKYAEHKDALHLFMSENMNLIKKGVEKPLGVNGNWSAAEEAKVKATLASSSTRFADVYGMDITLDNAVMFGEVAADVPYGRTAVVDGKTGSLKIEKDFAAKTAIFDGMSVFLVDDENIDKTQEQIRIATNKSLVAYVPRVNWLQWIDSAAANPSFPQEARDKAIAARKCFEDKNIKLILNESCCKGWKWYGTSWKRYKEEMKKANLHHLRVLAHLEPDDTGDFVDAEDELPANSRYLSRQVMQEFIYMTPAQAARLAEPSKKALLEAGTPEGVAEAFAKPGKQDAGNAEILFREVPNVALLPEVEAIAKQRAERKFAQAMVSPIVKNTRYVKILQDPVAFLHTVVLGIDPNKHRVGCMQPNTCYTGDNAGQKVFMVRFPANLLNARVLPAVEPEELKIFRDCLVFSVYDKTLTGYMDGDVDGDGATISTDRTVIEMTEEMISRIDPPAVFFDHEKAEKDNYPANEDDLAYNFAKLWADGVYWNQVGAYSNLAMRIINALRKEMSAKQVNGLLEEASFPHIMTILVIDYVKTGKLPEGIAKRALEIRGAWKEVKLPYHQRYMKHSPQRPYHDREWDNETMPLAENILDSVYGKAVRGMFGGRDFAWSGDMFEAARKDTGFTYRQLLKVGRFTAPNKTAWPAKYMWLLDHMNTKTAAKALHGELLGMLDAAKVLFDKNNALANHAINGRHRQEITKAAMPVFRACLTEMFMSASAKRFEVESVADAENWVASYLLNQVLAYAQDKNFGRKELFVMFLFSLFGDIYAANAKLPHPEPEKNDNIPKDSALLSESEKRQVNDLLVPDDGDVPPADTIWRYFNDFAMSDEEISRCANIPEELQAPAKPKVVPAKEQPVIDVWTDGACKGNPGYGGYAAILKSGPHEKCVSGSEEGLTTNQRMELKGLEAALAALKSSCTLNVHTDSQYVCTVLNSLTEWKAAGWKNKSKKEVSNKDILINIDNLITTQKIKVIVIKVAGHSGDELNERADKLASAKAEEAKARAAHAEVGE